MEQVTRRIIGVGYEGHTLPSFLAALSVEKVECVVDVRLNAISRKRGFSKRLLTASLAEAGIEYLHLPTLGNPKENRDGFWKPGTDLAAQAHAGYRRVLQSEKAVAAMRELVEKAATASVALLCFEAREETCHRHLILDELDSFQLAGSHR
ncbi:DUF488 domain-containing protein [Arthrobacter sp. MDT2-16]